MNQHIVIGVDVGGSHITSAAIDLSTLQIISNSTKSSKINNKGTKEEILRDWNDYKFRLKKHLERLKIMGIIYYDPDVILEDAINLKP